MTDLRRKPEAPWRRHLTGEEAREIAALDWQLKVQAMARSDAMRRRYVIQNRATQRLRLARRAAAQQGEQA